MPVPTFRCSPKTCPIVHERRALLDRVSYFFDLTRERLYGAADAVAGAARTGKRPATPLKVKARMPVLYKHFSRDLCRFTHSGRLLVDGARTKTENNDLEYGASVYCAMTRQALILQSRRENEKQGKWFRIVVTVRPIAV